MTLQGQYRDTRPPTGRFLWTHGVLALGLMFVFISPTRAQAQLGPADVLILVNGNSPISQQVADLYRQYYPEITDSQVFYLWNLPDCASPTSTPADEIITRDQFNENILSPLRDYLITSDMVNSVFCIITTAGMPYRIEDTAVTLANIIYPAGSDANLTVANRSKANAASVESELSVLFQIDPNVQDISRLPIENRLVNPYQGYRGSIKQWASGRNVLERRYLLRWASMMRVPSSPRIEGLSDKVYGYSSKCRTMTPADIYLVARLDGPHQQGKNPFFAVRRMLERSARVSNPNHPGFVGYNPDNSISVIDSTPACPSGCAYQYTYSATYNMRPNFDLPMAEDAFTPPGSNEVPIGFNEANHYRRGFLWLTGVTAPSDTTLVRSEPGLACSTLWNDTKAVMNQSWLPADHPSIISLVTYGCNGAEGRSPAYLTTGGPGGTALFQCNPGAVFSSLESFNAVTMFTSTATVQAKIVDFMAIGGSGAIGHAFEPETGGLIQADYLMFNYLFSRYYGCTWVEAAYTALPYLSWAEIVIGDPLMQLEPGPGGIAGNEQFRADFNGDNEVDDYDRIVISAAYSTYYGGEDYVSIADLNEDGAINDLDYMIFEQQRTR